MSTHNFYTSLPLNDCRCFVQSNYENRNISRANIKDGCLYTCMDDSNSTLVLLCFFKGWCDVIKTSTVSRIEEIFSCYVIISDTSGCISVHTTKEMCTKDQLHDWYERSDHNASQEGWVIRPADHMTMFWGKITIHDLNRNCITLIKCESQLQLCSLVFLTVWWLFVVVWLQTMRCCIISDQNYYNILQSYIMVVVPLVFGIVQYCIIWLSKTHFKNQMQTGSLNVLSLRIIILLKMFRKWLKKFF